MDAIVGLDAGTTATKAVAVAADATVLATASAGYPLLVPAPGRAELDPFRLQTAAVEALTGVVARCRDAGHRVVAVSLSAAMHGLVPLDDDGTPRGPLVTWADGRAAAEARGLSAATRGAIHARTGTPVHPMAPLSKLLWWRLRETADFLATPRWGGVKEVMLGALCDGDAGSARLIDLSCASTTGLYDIVLRRYDPEALLLSGVPESQLATVVPSTTMLPGLRRDVATVTGLPAGLPVIIGASDGPLANLGVGAVTDGVAAVSLGTSGALRALRPAPEVDPGLRLFCYALTEDRWVVGGALNNAGSVVRWASVALGLVAPDVHGDVHDVADAQLMHEAGPVPAGSEGLLCLPYLLGERAPWWEPGLRGAWIGLRRHHTRGHLVRSAVEGVCQQLALVKDALAQADVPVHEVRATGGAMESPVWRAVLTATLDVPVRLAASPEGTATGAAMLGYHALGALPDLDDVATLVTVDRAQPPDPHAVDIYRRARPLVERCTIELRSVFDELDDLR